MAQVAQQAAAKASANPGHYLQKSDGCQILRVESDKNDIAVNLAGLIPTFNNLNNPVGNANAQSEIYYQVKQFRYRNIFYNIYPGDKIWLQTSLSVQEFAFIQQFMLDPNPVLDVPNTAYYTYDNPTHIEIDISTDKAECVDLVTLINRLNLRINAAIMRNSAGNLANNYYMQLATLMDYGQFQYINGYLGFQFNFSDYGVNQADRLLARFAQFFIPVPANINANKYCLTNCSISLIIPSTLAKKARYRLSSIFGTADVINIDGTNCNAVTNKYSYKDLTYHLYQNFSLVDKNNQFDSYIPGRYKTDQIDPQIVGIPMYQMPFDSIYIRSNAHSNLWSEIGSRTNVIAIIPIQTSYENFAQVWDPVGADARTYNIKDSINTFQHLQLRFTDATGELIDFPYAYELEIAIFYVPPDSSLINM